MKDVEKAYIAGIVDGEGTVTLSKRHKNETPTPRVSVSNTDLKLLNWIKSKVGGIIVSKKKYKSHHVNAYAWYVCQDRAINLLNDIKMFLIIKRKQADLITNEYLHIELENIHRIYSLRKNSL